MTTFVSRGDWGHFGARGGYEISGAVHLAVVHHTPGQDPTSYDGAVDELHQILGTHLGNGWADIGYTWLVWDRFAFEGRGFGRTGAHAPGANSTSVGIAFILDGRYRLPTATEWATAAGIMDRAQNEGWAGDYAVHGHRDHVATACPGDLLYANLGLWGSTGASAPDALPGTGVGQAVTENRIDLVVVGTDYRVWQQAIIGGEAYGWQQVGDLRTDHTPAVVRHGPDWLHFYATEKGTGRIMQASYMLDQGKWANGGQWYEVPGGGRSLAGISAATL